MTTQSNATTVELPSGCRHYDTSVVAETWEAYDALTPDDGWVEYDLSGFRWKRGEIRGHEIVVHAPDKERAS